MKSNSKTNVNILKLFILIPLSLMVSFYCATNVICEGLEFLFILPLAFGISLLVLPAAHSYWKANIGFTILFVSIWVKYLVTPALMTLSQSTVNTLHPNVSSLRISSFLAVFELFATLIMIQHLWKKHLEKNSNVYEVINKPSIISHAGFQLHWTGLAFLAVLVVIVLVRGHLSGLFTHLSTWFSQASYEGEFYSYDLIAFEVIKTGIVLLLISFLAKRYYATSSNSSKMVIFSLALGIAVLNTYYFQYDQRTALTQLILATLFMFLSFFPKQKKIIIPVAMFFGIGLIAIVFLDGTLHYSVGDSISSNFVTELSKMAELYDSGPTVVATTIDSVSSARSLFSFETIWSDIIHSFNFLSMLPFTRWLWNSAQGIPTTNELFKNSIGGFNYILPNYSLASYYVSEIFGWLLELVFIWITIKLICYVEGKKLKYNDALYYYAFTYIETILGQAIFVNNFRLLWHSFSKLPIWLLVFAFVNSLGKKFKIGHRNYGNKYDEK